MALGRIGALKKKLFLDEKSKPILQLTYADCYSPSIFVFL